MERLQTAAEEGAPVFIFADADPDGITAAVICKEALQNTGAGVERVAFPDLDNSREAELDAFVEELTGRSSAGVLVIMDTGTSSYEAIEKAQANGYAVIVVDHHDVHGELPPAHALINPEREDDTSGTTDLATAGLAYELANELLGGEGSAAFRQQLVILAALGTIADRMPLENNNADMVREGLAALPDTFRPGLRALWETDEVQDLAPDTNGMAEKVNAALGAGQPLEYRGHETYELLTCGDMERARELARLLLERHAAKQEEVAEIVESVTERYHDDNTNMPILFVGDELWSKAALGSAASRLIKRYRRPIFLYTIDGDEIRASARVPNDSDFDSVAALTRCSDLFTNFGGHPMASGFSADRENVEAIKKCLVDAYYEQMGE